MKKGIIYYTHNQLDKPIFSIVQKELLKTPYSITSCSLKPMNFGKNIVLDLKPGIITMFKQILAALENSEDTFVFFCEHDVLYSKSHFDFEPLSNSIFYYNTNVWQWKYPKDFLITYDNLRSLSGLCVNREFAIEHYKKRLEIIEKNNWQEEDKEPIWVKRMGYEPGTKSKRQEIVSNDISLTYRSRYPNIDIRHRKTLSPAKMKLENFHHKPTGWKEIKLKDIKNFNLNKIFNL